MGSTRPGEGEGWETEEEKAVGYTKRALSLLRDMESIRDHAEAKEPVAAANEKGEEEEEEDNEDWYGNIGKNSQEEGEEGGGGGSGRGEKGGSMKDSSYDSVDRESTPATGSPDMESYALVIEAWVRHHIWILGGRGGGGGEGGGGGRNGIYLSSIRQGSST